MSSRAVVLGAGGITGIAWQLGLLAGLSDRGVDLTEADLVVGTSAGAVVGALLLGGADLEARYQRELEGARGERPGRLGLRNLVRLGLAFGRAGGPTDIRRRVGELALSARTESELERLRTVADWLGDVRHWPASRLLVTAVNAVTGDFVTFDRFGEADLLSAVAASCASPGVRPPITIGSERFIDGGIRSPANADLAQGHDRVVVLTPTTNVGQRAGSAAEEIERLRTRSRVVHVVPDHEARKAVGLLMPQMLRPARRAQAAEAGREQAVRVSAEIVQLWSAAG